MKLAYTGLILLVVAGALASCSGGPTQSVDVTDRLNKSLAEAGFTNVTVSQDREKGIVTLGGRVASQEEKERAESVARPIAGTQVLALEIAVIPPGAETDAKSINSDVDKGIGHNLDAALTASRLQDAVKFDVNNAVVTLKGEVDSQAKRELAERVAGEVPYVKQVVNTLQIKNQKATSR